MTLVARLADELKARGVEPDALRVEWFPTFGRGCHGVSVEIDGRRVTRMYPKGEFYPDMVADWLIAEARR